MKIQTQPPIATSWKALPQGQPPRSPETFEPGQPPAEPTHTSWFHRATGAVAGGTALATLGTVMIGSLGNGRGGDGLIFPIVGFLGGAGLGLVAGALAAGSAHSNEEHTSLYHRATAIASGAVLGGLAGMVLLAPAGNGMGGDGLIYPAVGLAGGTVLGAVGLGIAAGHFPDRRG